MIFVDRTQVPSPPSLLDKGVEESAKAIAHYHAVPTPDKSYPFKAYKRQDIKDALNSLFAGKCAYCESFIQNHPMDIEHYRPKNGVIVRKNGRDQLQKPGYYWLAANWHNLLPSCIDCNRLREQELPQGGSGKLGKANRFPLRSETTRATHPSHLLDLEDPLLLHPCCADPNPDQHLEFLGEGLVRQALVDNTESEYGQATIDVCGLQRLGLVTARKVHYLLLLERFETLFFLRDRINDHVNDEADLALLQARFARKIALLNKMVEPDQPYAGMTRQLLPRLKEMHKAGWTWAQALQDIDPGP